MIVGLGFLQKIVTSGYPDSNPKPPTAPFCTTYSLADGCFIGILIYPYFMVHETIPTELGKIISPKLTLKNQGVSVPRSQKKSWMRNFQSKFPTYPCVLKHIGPRSIHRIRDRNREWWKIISSPQVFEAKRFQNKSLLHSLKN